MLKRFAQAGAWAALDSFSAAFLAFSFFVVTARLLTPSQFGVGTLVLSIFQVLQPLIDSLFHDAVVQKEKITREDVTTAATFCLAWSIFLALALWLLAPSIASLLSVPELSSYLPPLGIALVFAGASAVVTALARRNLEFRVLAIRTICARAIGLVAGIWMAWHGYGVWSIVGNIILTAVLSSAFLLMATGFPIGKIHLDRLKPFLAFAGPTAGTQFLLMGNTRVITLIIGGFLGPVAAGIWGVAFRFVEPLQVIFATAIGQTILPLFSRRQSDRAEIARYFVLGTHALAIVFVPIFVGLAYCAPDVIRIFVGENWIGATPIMRIVCIGTAVILLRLVPEIALTSIGSPRYTFFTHAIGAALSILGVAFGVLFGLLPAAFGWALRVIPFLTINASFVRKELKLNARDQFSGMAPALFSSLIMCIGMYYLDASFLSASGSAVRVAYLNVAGAAIYGICLALVDARARRLLAAIARGKSPLG